MERERESARVAEMRAYRRLLLPTIALSPGCGSAYEGRPCFKHVPFKLPFIGDLLF